MISSLFALSLVVQGQQATMPQPHVGSSAEFLSLVRQIAVATNEGDFAQANDLAKKLPSRKIKVKINWDGVDASQKSYFEAAIERSKANWKSKIKGLDFESGSKPDILISFSDSLPNREDINVPKGAVHFWSTAPAEPRLEAVIGLKRGEQRLDADPLSIDHEFAYAVGAYLGVADGPTAAAMMYRIDQLVSRKFEINHGEADIAERALRVAEEVRAIVSQKKPIPVAAPKAVLSATEYVGEPVIEGHTYFFSFLVTNTGDSPLQLEVKPDCSCFTVDAPPTVAPGATAHVRVISTTQGFQGPQDKRLVVYTNDPEAPIQKFAFRAFIKPLIRLLAQDNDEIIQVRENQTVVRYLAYASDGRDFQILKTSLSGMNGTVKVTPWSGNLADADLQEAEKPRKGYVIEAEVDTTWLQGRKGMSLIVQTDQKPVDKAIENVTLQKGLAVTPDNLYFGRFKRAPRSLTAEVRSAGSDFKIVKVSTSDPGIEAKVVQVDPKRVRVTVLFNGTADFGPYDATVTLETTDPTQKLITIPVQAYVQ